MKRVKKIKTSYINRSLKFNPSNPEALRMKVDLLNPNNKYHTLNKLYTKYLHLMPLDHFMHYKYALLLAQKKLYTRAVKHFSISIEIESQNEYYYLHRGGSYNALKQYDKSIGDFTKGLEINNKNAWLYYNRAITYQGKKDFPRAIKDHNRAIAIDSSVDWFYYNRGNCYFSLEKYNMALKDYENALAINPKNHWALYNKGHVEYYYLNRKPRGKNNIRNAAHMGNPNARSTLKNIK